ncbi:MAG: LysE family translocator [Planctomycetota bacterium]
MFSIDPATASAFFAASLLLAITPGPDNLFVLAQSIALGRKAGYAVTAGLCSGLLFHTSMVALGVAGILVNSPIAMRSLEIFGAVYLMYIAWSMLHAPATNTEPTTTDTKSAEYQARETISPLLLYLRGVIMNVSNPKVSLFFLAFLPGFIDADASGVFAQTISLGLLFMASTAIVFGAVATTAGWLQQSFESRPDVQIWIYRSSAIVLSAIALHLLCF